MTSYNRFSVVSFFPFLYINETERKTKAYKYIPQMTLYSQPA